ncbi:DUF4245 domain-containing protein [Rhizomonospora bruguierae]|uniref:DUF4245 domain-containing protein n=1 Tax=Rhizomonospora bruguierae TaxID=1581705 RepID=UPI001BCD5BE8|nr:DUF4245 domain-containing protein [Micromonospora sp. NBRC 107566]
MSTRGPRDILLSLLVLLIPVVVVVAIYRVVQGGDQPVVVDPAPAVADARAAKAFPVAEPAGLPSGWQPIRATYRDRTLRIGYRTPKGGGVQLVERPGTTDPGQAIHAELSDTARPLGTVDIAGRTWQRYAGRPGESGLVLLEPSRTVVVLGNAAEAELTSLAAALRA